MLKPSEINSDLLRSRMKAALRLHIGPHREFSYTDAAKMLEIDQRTVESHCRGETVPTLGATLAYMTLPDGAGDDIAAHVLALIGKGGARPIKADECDPWRLLAIMTHEAAIVAEMMEDGRLDHQERVALAPRLRTLSAKLASYADAIDPERGAYRVVQIGGGA